MRFKTLLPVALLLTATFFLTACGNGRQTVRNEPAAQFVAGSWRGLLPCADCPGIDYTLNLHAGGHYEETMVYQERAVDPFKSGGAWKLGKDSIVTLQAATGNNKQYLRFTGKDLIVLGADKKEAPAVMADRFRLTRRPEGSDRATQDRLERGIIFAATGNEPFWSVELTAKGQVFFKAMDGPEMQAQAKKDVARDEQAHNSRYTATQGSNILALSVIQKKCTDDMSGAMSNWSVEAVFTENGKEKVFQGCGTYMGDYQLQNIWLLRHLDDENISSKDYPDGVPSLEFEMDEKRVSGFAGCNRYFGNFEMAGQFLLFQQMGSTRMACPASKELESRFLKILSGQKLAYSVQGKSLRLSGDGHTLVFEQSE